MYNTYIMVTSIGALVSVVNADLCWHSPFSLVRLTDDRLSLHYLPRLGISQNEQGL